MTLPPDIRFSQASLQDFHDCRRRFELRYIDRLDWPALESEPALEHEAQMRLGAQFHRLVQQHLLGLDPARIGASIRDPLLRGWWQNYLDHPIPDLPALRRPEYVLTAPVAGHRLLAKFDLLAVDPGERAVIVDWKTSPRPQGRRWLAERLQTLVYRFIAVEATAHLNGGVPFKPEQVSLVYWFAGDPESAEVFEYTSAEHDLARERLAGVITEIAGLESGGFPLTDDFRTCRFCVYRSLCGRGATRLESWSSWAPHRRTFAALS